MYIKKFYLFLVIFMLGTHMSAASSDSDVSSFIESDSWDDIYKEITWDERFEEMYTKLIANIHMVEVFQKTKFITLCAEETEALKRSYALYQKMPSEETLKCLLDTYLRKFKSLASNIIIFMRWACPRKPNQLITFENPIEFDGKKSVTVAWIASGRVRATWPITYPLEYKDLVELELILAFQWFEPQHSPCGKEVEPYRPVWDALNGFINAIEQLIPENKFPPRINYKV